MTSLLEALPGILLVLGLPGVLVLLALRVRMTWIEAAAAVPVCSIGAIWLLAELCQVTGLPFAPATFAVLVVALAVPVVVQGARRRYRPAGVPLDLPDRADGAFRRDDRPGPDSAGMRVRLRLAFGLLGLGVVIGAAVWIPGGMADSVTPPAGDAATHAFLIERIARTESVESSDVLVTDARGGGTLAGKYYPLAVHASLAIASSVTGASDAALITDTTLVFALLVLPAGLFALTRMLLPDLPLAAGFAALLGQLIGGFPYEPFGWGGFSIIVGMSALPIILVLLYRTLISSRVAARAIALSALLVLTLLSLYVSVLLLLLLFVGLLVLERAWSERSLASILAPLVRLVIVGVVVAVASLPVLVNVSGGATERQHVDLYSILELRRAVKLIVTMNFFAPPATALALLAGAGILCMLWQRRLVAWMVGALAIIGLATLAGISRGSLAETFTLPWYHQASRITLNLIYFIPVFAGALLALGCELLARIDARHPVRAIAGALAVVVVLTAVITVRPVRDNHRYVDNAYRISAVVGDDEVAAFRFLERTAPRDGLVVVDSNLDGNLWMYPLAGAKPLFGVVPADTTLYRRRDLSERQQIRDTFPTLGKNPKLDRLLDRYRAQYVYFGERTFNPYPHRWGLTTLQMNPRLREVFHQGYAHVFRILPPVGANP